MNEELQATLNDALVQIIEGATTAKEFIVAEIPEVVQQLLLWKMTVSLIGFSIGLLVLVGLVAAYILIGRSLKDEDFWLAGGCFFAIISVVPLVIMSESLAWLQILIAPKLYLIEYAAGLVGK